MGKQTFGRNQQPQNVTAPDPVAAPQPPALPVVFRSEHAARSFEARQRSHYATVSADAETQASHAAWLAKQITDLNTEIGQDDDVIARAKAVIAEREEAIRQRRERIALLDAERQERLLQSQNNRDDADATAELLRLHGFQPPAPAPRGDVLVAPVDPAPTGPQVAPLICGCGDPMELDREGKQYIHQSDDGWEIAGEACKRRRSATLTMPPVGDEVAAS